MKVSMLQSKFVDHPLDLLPLPPIIGARPLENEVPIYSILYDHISKYHKVAVEFAEQSVVLGHSFSMAVSVLVPALGESHQYME